MTTKMKDYIYHPEVFELVCKTTECPDPDLFGNLSNPVFNLLYALLFDHVDNQLGCGNLIGIPQNVTKMYLEKALDVTVCPRLDRIRCDEMDVDVTIPEVVVDAIKQVREFVAISDYVST